MGLHHIKYVPKAHGIAKYFAAIETHRTELASLPKPKLIADWQVVAKALRELPPLHQKLKTVAWILEVQRKIDKSETSLQQCRQAFVSADVDHNISAELQTASPSKKRRLRINITRTGNDKRPRDGRTPGRYKPGDCIHHPKYDNHLTSQCMNPFGIRSAFGLAQSYTDKCSAVKISVAAGWSPKATNVRIPQGYGCDPPVTTMPTANTPVTTVRANISTVQQVGHSINAADLQSYHKVRSLMNGHSNLAEPVATTLPVQSLPNTNQHQLQTGLLPPTTVPPPIRAFHTAATYPMYHGMPYAQPTIVYPQPAIQQQHPFVMPTQVPSLQMATPQVHMPAPIRANAANLR